MRVEQPFLGTPLTFLIFSLIMIFIVRILLVGCSFSCLKHTLRNGVTCFQPLRFTLSNILSRNFIVPLTCMILNLFTEKSCIYKKDMMNLNDFHDRFIHLCYEFSEDDIDWNFMKERF